jgi:hypothetical protein
MISSDQIRGAWVEDRWWQNKTSEIFNKSVTCALIQETSHSKYHKLACSGQKEIFVFSVFTEADPLH